MRVLIAGRWAHHRSALKAFLLQQPGLEVVAEASDIQPLLTAQAKATQPDVVLLDSYLDARPLDELVHALHTLDCRPGVVLLSARPEAEQAALAAGVEAFVLKGTSSRNLLLALEAIRLKREGGEA
jgi:DNA-binding NarL/FixJ family response regulator